jgi:hypothetical protein
LLFFFPNEIFQIHRIFHIHQLTPLFPSFFLGYGYVIRNEIPSHSITNHPKKQVEWTSLPSSFLSFGFGWFSNAVQNRLLSLDVDIKHSFGRIHLEAF